jgi:hypothetical protein
VDAHFEEMLRRLMLTDTQRADAKAKYQGVAKVLHDEFYETEYNGNTKLIIGSYGKKTNIRPPEDVDLLFKIPLEIFEQYQNHTGNGPAALLQRIRSVLGVSYTTTDKISAWGKVVLVEFADGKHNVELLPGYELDGVFMIPNTEDGGSWESFDARADLNLIADSHTRTGGRTRKLVRMIKKWRKLHSGMTIKSYEIEQYCVEFLNQQEFDDTTWSKLVNNFFEWLVVNAQRDTTFIETARDRASKAREYELNEDLENACQQWIKVFGSRTFPVYSTARDKVYKLNSQYPSGAEEYIEDMYPVRIDPAHVVSISATVSGKGFRDHNLGGFLARFQAIPRRLSLSFEATSSVIGPTECLWKVRNFGEDAKSAQEGKGLRGEIRPPSRDGKKYETTLYKGIHYVECYIIQNGICVAKALQFVPITQDEIRDGA